MLLHGYNAAKNELAPNCRRPEKYISEKILAFQKVFFLLLVCMLIHLMQESDESC